MTLMCFTKKLNIEKKKQVIVSHTHMAEPRHFYYYLFSSKRIQQQQNKQNKKSSPVLIPNGEHQV